MRRRWIGSAWLLVAVVGCGSSGTPAVMPTPVAGDEPEAAPLTALASETTNTAARDPGAALIASERAIWTLEGMLLAEADAALRDADARQALGDPAILRYTDGAEARARKYLRSKRSAEARTQATAFLAVLNRTSLAMLGAVAEQTGLAVEDVFMDYLTYDALFDLAMMRYGHKRWKQGLYTGEAKALADSFFSLVPEAPSAKHGIKVVAGDGARIELSVFGGRVIETVTRTEVRDVAGIGKVGIVDWTSNYEQLRGGIRGGEPLGSHTEELEWHSGTYGVNYAVELDEYLSWSSTHPWAVALYLSSADEVADMYAGIAAAGGLEAGSSVALADLDALPREGELGRKGNGLAVKVLDARARPRLGNVAARRGQFLVVTVAVSSSLAAELRAPSEWFRLATAVAEYPEQGVARPMLAPVLLPLATAGARMLGMPYTALAPGKTTTLVLVYDVPSDLARAALVLGADELALQVAVN